MGHLAEAASRARRRRVSRGGARLARVRQVRQAAAACAPTRIEELVAADVASLIAALGRDQADVVGHDWGGEVAWHLAMRHPGRSAAARGPERAAPAAIRQGAPDAAATAQELVHVLLPAPGGCPRSSSPTRGRGRRFATLPAGARRLQRRRHRGVVEAARRRTGPIHYYRAALRHPSRAGAGADGATLVIRANAIACWRASWRSRTGAGCRIAASSTSRRRRTGCKPTLRNA